MIKNKKHLKELKRKIRRKHLKTLSPKDKELRFKAIKLKKNK